MRTLISALILTISLCSSSFAQNSNSVELIINPSIDYRHLSSTAIHGQSVVSERNGLDNPRFGYRIAANYSLQLQNNFFLKSGLGFLSIGTISDERTLRWPSQNDGNGNFDPNSGQSEGDIFQTKESFQFLEMPLSIRYNPIRKKLRPIFEIGFGVNYLLGRKYIISVDGNSSSLSSEIPSEINKLQISTNLSIGLEYQFKNKLSVLFQPLARYHITPMASGSDVTVKENLYSFGIVFGIRKYIGKIRSDSDWMILL